MSSSWLTSKLRSRISNSICSLSSTENPNESSIAERSLLSLSRLFIKIAVLSVDSPTVAANWRS